VQDILYYCHGDFTGFVMESCGSRRRFDGCDRSLEELVLRACNERSKMTVLGGKGEIRQIIIHCC
jgi:hypothetical protein